MSLIVVAAIAAGVALAGAAGAFAASRARKARLRVEPAPPALPDHGLPLRVGDVVLRGNSELWLTGALVLFEGTESRGAVFLASSSAGKPQEAIVVAPGAPPLVAWVQRADEELAPRVLAATLEGAGETLSRRSRLPVRIEAQGETPAGVEATGTWMHYEGPSGAAAFVLAAGPNLLWRGVWLEQGEWTRLAAGSATLREL